MESKIHEALRYYERHVGPGTYGEALLAAAREELAALEALAGPDDATMREARELIARAAARLRSEQAAPPEPTTAEAFATAHAGLKDAKRGCSAAGERALEHVERHLSLLERRMGAMARALQGAMGWMRKDGGAKTGGEPCKHAGGCKWQRAEAVLLAGEAVLTDAPPVFTLEEVTDAMLDASKDMKGDDTPADFRDYVRERLSALRRG